MIRKLGVFGVLLAVNMCTIMRSFIRLSIVCCLLFSAISIQNQPAQASTDSSPEVITIYFAGTSMRQEMWKGDETPWGGHGELVALLYHNQYSDCQSQNKIFIDGIGSDKDKDCTVTSALASVPLCKNWFSCLKEARRDINNKLESGSGGDVILNIVGFSRGGILALTLAHQMQNDSRVTAINVLTFDPVSGELVDIPPESFILLSKVKQYVGIYSRDERTLLFKPTVPAISSPSETQVWMMQIPGSHETMVGNPEIDGHAIGYRPPGYSGEDLDQPVSIYKVTAMIAVELLSSPAWGKVHFNEAFLTELYGVSLTREDKESKFKEEVSELTNELDLTSKAAMRQSVFLPFPVSAVEYYSPVVATQCNWAFWFDPFYFSGLADDIRCAKWAIGMPNTSLSFLVQNELGEDINGTEAWSKLTELGRYNDSDKDGIPNDEDNCQNIKNVTQADRDGDGIGNACDLCLTDPDIDKDGDGICGYNNLVTEDSDLCPDDFNKGVDADNDGYDAVCDDDDSVVYDDGDEEDFFSDNCPYVENVQDDDKDGDGLGDVCDPCPDDPDNDSDEDGFCVGSSFHPPMRGANDLCPKTPSKDPTNIDTNGDTEGDFCDDNDDDDDYDDIVDNCPLHSNNSQEDKDDDGQGDPCDCDHNCDSDGDGWCEGKDEDCNDDDPSIYPGAIEVCGDNIDQDCLNGDSLCVALDIKPGSCPNPINQKDKGFLPIVILGDASFSPVEVDPESVTFLGLSPVKWSLEDVASPYQPYTGKQTCVDCMMTGPDGYLDLSLKFSMPEILDVFSLEQLRMTLPEDCIPLTLTGNLLEEFGGLAIQGEDVMRIRNPGERKKLEKEMAEATK